MTLKERNDAIETLWREKCLPILQGKGKDYSGIEDAYANFKCTAADLKLPPRKVLWIFLKKHLDAIRNAIVENPDNPTREGESFESSCFDAINYISILAAWPKEEQP